MSVYIGKKGKIRIYESTTTVRAAGVSNVERFDGVFTDITAAAHSAAASLTGTLLVTAGDFIYIGSQTRFPKVNVDVSVAAIGTGAITVEYYNGTTFTAITAALHDLVDGTASGGDTLAIDGEITFKVPPDWELQGDASLDADKYYIRISAAGTPGTPPNCEQIASADGGLFIETKFDQIDFTTVEGRPRPEEILVLDRANLTADACYVEGEDDVIDEPQELSWSLRLYFPLTAGGATKIREAIKCGDPEETTWTGTGVTTKGDTANNGVDANPQFADGLTAEKKTVAVQIIWDDFTVPPIKIGRELNEVWFDLAENSIVEAVDSVMVNLTGQCFGTIEEIAAFGYRH